MNFLAHLYFSGNDPEILVGNLMGDFVKGRLDDRYPPGIKKGLELHRAIDSFAGRNEHFIRSRRRLNNSFGLYRGILVDLFYDHFLALTLDDDPDSPLQDFIAHCRSTLEAYREILPDPLRSRLPVLFDDWLPSYCRIDGIDRVLKRMSGRIRRPNPLGDGARELEREYVGLREDYSAFVTELAEFVARYFAEKRRS